MGLTTKRSRAARSCLLLVIITAFALTPLRASKAKTTPSLNGGGSFATQTDPERKRPRAQTKGRPPLVRRVARKVWNFLKCRPAQRSKEAELARKKGLEFPDDYDPSAFSIVARFKGGEPIVLVHKLEPQSRLVVALEMLNVPTFVKEFPYDAVPGASQVDELDIPVEFGNAWRAGLLTLRAVKGDPSAPEPAEYEFAAIAIGREALTEAQQKVKDTPGILTPASSPSAANTFLFAAASYGPRRPSAPMEVDTVSLYDLSLKKLLVGRFPAVSFSFSTSRRFGRWRAEFRRQEPRPLQGGAPAQTMRFIWERLFDEPLRPERSPIGQTWDGSDEEGRRAPGGKYQLIVMAWQSALHQGESAARASSTPRLIWP